MARGVYKLKSKVIVYPGMNAWRFLVVPVKQGKEIKETYGKVARGWGSLRVVATIGKTKWSTSIFPDKKSGTYVLPLKSEVRSKEGITDRSTVQFSITL